MNLFHVKVQTSTIRPEQIIPRLRLPNLALESGRCCSVEKKLSELKGWADLADLIPRDAIFKFQWGDVEIFGETVKVSASVPGEYAIPIPVCNAGRADILLLQVTVIQDPWVMLMQEKDQPAGAPYQKSPLMHTTEPMGMFGGYVVAASRRGQGHACHGAFRDDDYEIAQIEDKNIFLLAVADGAGSARYAREGSRIAVEAAMKSLLSSFANDAAVMALDGAADGDLLSEILTVAAKSSRDAIASEVENFNASPKEAGVRVTAHDYNTTLLLSVVKVLPDCGARVVSFAIGDGAIVWVSECDDDFALLSKPDDGAYAGETEFVTSDSIWRQYDENRCAFYKRRVRTLHLSKDATKHGTLLMMTDGVSDPFFASHAKLNESGLWRSFLDSEIRQKARIEKNVLPSEDLSDRLLSWLNFKANTHFDDRTLIIWEPSVDRGIRDDKEA